MQQISHYKSLKNAAVLQKMLQNKWPKFASMHNGGTVHTE